MWVAVAPAVVEVAPAGVEVVPAVVAPVAVVVVVAAVIAVAARGSGTTVKIRSCACTSRRRPALCCQSVREQPSTC